MNDEGRRLFKIEKNIYGYYSILEIIGNEETKCYDTAWNELNFFKTLDEASMYVQGIVMGIL